MHPDVSDEAQKNVRLDDLAAMRLFAGADPSSIRRHLGSCPVKRLFEGELLIAPGLGGHALYLVLEGRLRVHLGSLERPPVRLPGAGEAVGGSSVVRGRPVYVVADRPSTVRAIDHETFWSLVYAEHAVARNMLKMMLEEMGAPRSSSAWETTGEAVRHRRRAQIDGLTGLPGRASLLDLLRRQILRSAMGAKPLSVLVVAIDDFAPFASAFGKAAAEEVLCTVAGILRDQIRPTDIVGRPDDTHRFAVVLPECNEQGARQVAHRLAEAVAHAVIAMPDQSILPPVTISIGIAERRDGVPAEELLETAGSRLPVD